MKGNLFRFKPSKELWVVLSSWLLVVALFYLSFQIITTQRMWPQFITFGIIGIAGLGVFVPTVWTTFVMKRSISALGIKKEKLFLSIGLCLGLTLIQYFMTLRTITLPPWNELIPLFTMAVAVGFFENVFFRGWVQLRFEDSFGIISAIILSSILYSLYHVGYGMRVDEMAFLFIIGLIYSIIFKITSNIFILFPFLTPTGAIFTQIKDGLTLPFEATYGFLDVIALIAIGLYFIDKYAKKKALNELSVQNKNSPE